MGGSGAWDSWDDGSANREICLYWGNACRATDKGDRLCGNASQILFIGAKVQTDWQILKLSHAHIVKKGFFCKQAFFYTLQLMFECRNLKLSH